MKWLTANVVMARDKSIASSATAQAVTVTIPIQKHVLIVVVPKNKLVLTVAAPGRISTTYAYFPSLLRCVASEGLCLRPRLEMGGLGEFRRIYDL